MFYGAQAACFSFTYGVFRSIFTRLFSLKRFENVSTWKTEIYILFFIMKNIAEWIFINTLFAFCENAQLWRWLVVFFLDCFTLPSSSLSLTHSEMFQVEAFKVSYYFLHTNRKLLFEVWTSSLWSSPRSFLNIFYVTNSYEFFGLSYKISEYNILSSSKIHIMRLSLWSWKIIKINFFFAKHKKKTTTLVSPRHMSSRAH